MSLVVFTYSLQNKISRNWELKPCMVVSIFLLGIFLEKFHNRNRQPSERFDETGRQPWCSVDFSRPPQIMEFHPNNVPVGVRYFRLVTHDFRFAVIFHCSAVSSTILSLCSSNNFRSFCCCWISLWIHFGKDSVCEFIHTIMLRLTLSIGNLEKRIKLHQFGSMWGYVFVWLREPSHIQCQMIVYFGASVREFMTLVHAENFNWNSFHIIEFPWNHLQSIGTQKFDAIWWAENVGRFSLITCRCFNINIFHSLMLTAIKHISTIPIDGIPFSVIHRQQLASLTLERIALVMLRFYLFGQCVTSGKRNK